MLKIILTVVMIIALLISIQFVRLKRKRLEITGFKTLLTPICFYFIAINSLILIWVEKFGILFWTINIILLFLAAYFSKNLPTTMNEQNN